MRYRLLLVGVPVVGLVVMATPLVGSHASVPTCGAGSARPVNVGNTWLNGVAVVSACDAVAVGAYDTYPPHEASGVMIERWNGTAWTVQYKSHYGRLNAVGFSSADNGWAVGAGQRALVLNWNGTKWAAAWRSRGAGELFGIAVISRTDAWAVGTTYGATASRPVVEHWNGRSWTRVAIPLPSSMRDPGSSLYAVSADGPRDVWAVGDYAVAGGWGRALIEHWTGSRWHLVVSPRPAGSISEGVRGVDVVSRTDAWAVGSYDKNTDATVRPFAEHWDGHAWTPAFVPGAVADHVLTLNGVTILSRSNVWAVGSITQGIFPSPPSQTVIEHWDGTEWQHVASPDPGGTGIDQANMLNAISGHSANDTWAVGFYSPGPSLVAPSQFALALRCCRWQA